MKRSLLISIFLLFLFFFPSQVMALSCVELQVKYLLACEDGACEGFTVQQEYKGGGCQRVPYVVDIKNDEGLQIYNHLHSVTEQIERNGFWFISTNSDCVFALRRDRNDDYTQDRLNRNCGLQGERIHVEKLAPGLDSELMQTRRAAEEKDAQSARISFYFSQLFWIAVSLSLAVILPLLIILKYLRGSLSFVPYVILVWVVQISIIFYLLNLSGSLYLDWAFFSLVIIIPAFFIGIGVLVGAKLKNHKTRVH